LTQVNMGNAAPQAVASQQNQNPRDILQESLPNFIVQEQLGNGKFMKSFRCKVDGMPVIVKVYIKRDPNEDLSVAQEQIRELTVKLKPTDHPNLLPYHIPIEFQRSAILDRRARLSPAPAAFLVRQALFTSLYDRLSTRPFLAMAEKKWLVYQLFKAVEQLHSVGLWHGDLKTENVMVTSWHWVTLVDMAPFKPIKLMHDNTAGVNYYFHSGEKRGQRCYLAPERFETPSERSQSRAHSRPRVGGGAERGEEGYRRERERTRTNSSMASDEFEEFSRALAQSRMEMGVSNAEDKKQLQAMDIFSLGCVIAEVFLDGEAVLDLPDLVEYRKASADASLPKLNKPGNKLEICDKKVCRLVQHMTRRTPSERKTAQEYRERMEDPATRLFPTCFSAFLYGFMQSLHVNARTPDERVLTVCRNYGPAVQELAGLSDPAGEAFFRHYLIIAEGQASEERAPPSSHPSPPHATEEERQDAASEDLLQLMEETRRIIEEVNGEEFYDVPDVAVTGYIGKVAPHIPRAPPRRHLQSSPTAYAKKSETGGGNHGSLEGGNMLIILVQVVLSTMRHVRFPSTKLLALVLLVRLSQHLDDEAKLQRLVPYVVTMLEDPVAPVQASAVRALRSILYTVYNFPPSEAKLFPKYLFPAFQRLLVDAEDSVRVAFAESIGSFAETSRRFLDKAHAMNQQRASECELKDGENKQAKGPVLIKGSYDRELQELQGQVSRFVMPIVAYVDTGFTSHPGSSFMGGSGSLAKRALLKDIARLCVFFGHDYTFQSLLPQLITFLNDKDWELRSAFCEHIPAVCALGGEVSTTSFVLPCLENTLNDAHELVTGKALSCLEALIRMGLLSQELMLQKLSVTAPLLFHPSGWVRMGAIGLCGAISQAMEKEDAYVYLLPYIRPYLRYDLIGGEVNVTTIAEALQPPVSREAYQRALVRERERMNSSVGSTGISESETVSDSESAESGTSASVTDTEDSVDQVYVGRESSINSHQLSSNSEDSLDSYVSASNETPEEKPEKMVLATDTNDKDVRGERGSASRSKEHTDFGLPIARSMLALNEAHEGSANLRKVHSATEMATLDAVSSPVTSPRERSRKSTLDSGGLRLPGKLKAGERQKLALLKEYIRNVTEKRVNRQRAQVVTPREDSASSRWRAPMSDFSTANSLDEEPIQRQKVTLPEGLAQSVLIPDQRFTTLHPLPSQNTLEKLERLEFEAPREVLKCLEEGYGVTTRRTFAHGAARNFWNEDLSSDGAPGHQRVATPTNRQPLLPTHARTESEALSGPDLEKLATQDAADSVSLMRRLKALDAPPLPPDFGKLIQRNGKAYSMHAEPFNLTDESHSQREASPSISGGGGGSSKINVLISTLTEHSGSVNRLSVAQDQTFFASASSDGTVKIWDLRRYDQREMDITQIRSKVTHQGPGGEILDACMIENTHSIALATSEGHVQVARIDLMKPPTRNQRAKQQVIEHPKFTVAGSTELRTVNPNEGPILSVVHFNGDSFSLLVYATQKGFLHGWDLRSKSEAWVMQIRPEFGFLTAMSLGTDRNWLVTGTNRGYIMIWDLRFQLLSKVWQHNSYGPIYRLATCARLPFESIHSAKPLPRVFVAAGNNEAAAWDIFSGGTCQQCFRVLPPAKTPADSVTDTSLPKLEEIDVPTHPNSLLLLKHDHGTRPLQPASSIRTIMGRVSQEVKSHLITGGSDSFIRYWDYSSSMKCYTISGYELGQPRSVFEKYVAETDETNQLFVCRDASPPSPETVPAQYRPLTEKRGIVRPPNRHSDAVLDLKNVDLPMKMILSCSRDGVVKLWKK